MVHQTGSMKVLHEKISGVATLKNLPAPLLLHLSSSALGSSPTMGVECERISIGRTWRICAACCGKSAGSTSTR